LVAGVGWFLILLQSAAYVTLKRRLRGCHVLADVTSRWLLCPEKCHFNETFFLFLFVAFSWTWHFPGRGSHLDVTGMSSFVDITSSCTLASSCTWHFPGRGIFLDVAAAWIWQPHGFGSHLQLHLP